MDKSLKIDLLKALLSDLQMQHNQTTKDVTVIEGLELIIDGVERDDLEPINLTAKFFMDFAYEYEPLIELILSINNIDEVLKSGNKTLLMEVASRGYYWMCKCLVLNHVDIHKVVDGYNAFDYAYDNGQAYVSWLLFKLGSHLTGDRFEETEKLLQELPVPAGFAFVIN